MCGRAKPVKSDNFGVTNHPISPVANQSGAKQWRQLNIFQLRIDWKAKFSIRDTVLSESTVDMKARVDRGVTQIFLLAVTKPTVTAGLAKPRDTDAVSNPEFCLLRAKTHHFPNNLMARNYWKLRGFEFTIHNMQIGTADTAHAIAQENLVRPGERLFNVRQSERTT